MIDQQANDPNFAASREDAGLHERSFLQETLAGDFEIFTFGDQDPEASFAKIMRNMQADFAEFAKDVYGLDVNAPPPTLPKLVLDTRGSKSQGAQKLKPSARYIGGKIKPPYHEIIHLIGRNI